MVIKSLFSINHHDSYSTAVNLDPINTHFGLQQLSNGEGKGEGKTGQPLNPITNTSKGHLTCPIRQNNARKVVKRKKKISMHQPVPETVQIPAVYNRGYT